MAAEEAEKELQQGPPALSPAPQGSTVPGRAGILPSQGASRNARSLFGQHLSRPFARGALRRDARAALYRFAATPSRDLTSQSSFLDSLPLLGAGELFQGEVPRGRQAAMQQLGGDISANQTHWGEGQLGFRSVQSSPPSSELEAIRRVCRS